MISSGGGFAVRFVARRLPDAIGGRRFRFSKEARRVRFRTKARPPLSKKRMPARAERMRERLGSVFAKVARQ